MKSFNEWRNINESAPLPLEDHQRQEIWGIKHDLGPILKPQLKDLIAKVANDFEKSDLPKGRPENGYYLNIATAYILADLAKDYDSMMMFR